MDARLDLRNAPERRLAMTFQLRQALAILQMPQQELGLFLREEIDKNPLLEETGFVKKPFIEKEIAAEDSLHESIQRQIRENFSHPEDRALANLFFENLDEKGFISSSVETIAENAKAPIHRAISVLQVLQTFDPIGIFARNLQESLLIQLKAKGEENGQVFELAQKHFDDLLHGRYGAIKKKIEGIDLGEAIHKLALLQMRPLDAFKVDVAATIVPDLIIQRGEKGWIVAANNEELPQFQIDPKYESIETDSKEEKEIVQLWLNQGKWLLRSLSRRRKMLLEIGLYVVKIQSDYLSQKGNLKKLTIRDLCSRFQLHESTLSRALSGKYAQTPQGIIPLRSLIAVPPEANEMKRTLQSLIQEEDKTNPLTDNQLAEKLQNMGFKAARRTVSKYRREQGIGTVGLRKLKNKY